MFLETAAEKNESFFVTANQKRSIERSTLDGDQQETVEQLIERKMAFMTNLINMSVSKYTAMGITAVHDILSTDDKCK